MVIFISGLLKYGGIAKLHFEEPAEVRFSLVNIYKPFVIYMN